MEQFCILASTQKGRACVALIQQATSHKKIFTFGELLDVPSIQQLKEAAGTDGADLHKAFSTLELFAYGKYSDYAARASDFLPLSTQQLRKLRHLTVVSVCANAKIVPYAVLCAELGIDGDGGGTRELEDLLVECVYLGLIQGRIDQHGETLAVRAVTAARDVRPQHLPQLLAKLAAWRSKCSQLCDAHQASSAELFNAGGADARDWAALEADVRRLQKVVGRQLQEVRAEDTGTWMEAESAGAGGFGHHYAASELISAAPHHNAKRSRGPGGGALGKHFGGGNV